MKVRVRFGIKGASWLFPNACVFVLRQVPESKYATLLEAVTVIRGILQEIGQGEIADRIVCERS